MSLKRLELEGRIKKITLRPGYVPDQLAMAGHYLAAAKRNIDPDPDLAYGRSYAAMLAAGRALMGIMGYIPDGHEKYYSVELFLQQFFESKITRQFGIMRQKRHTLEYDQIGIISPADAKNAIMTAETFIQIIKEKIVKNNPGPG
jgi:uncharacterized protein (UPF0332 family)